MSDRSLLRLFLRYPLVTHKTIALIHWHALHLWRRGIPFQRHGLAARPSGHMAPPPTTRPTEVSR